MATPSSVAPKPTILVVQGSFQVPLVYEQLHSALKKLNYPVVHPRLPSCSNNLDDGSDFSKKNLVDDALAIRIELIRLIEYESKTVVVVMHSYGGLVGSEAIPQELSFQSRQEAGLQGGVIHLFYFSAFILGEGQSVLSAFGESPNNDVKPDGRMFIKNGASLLYNDLDEAKSALWESRLIAQAHNVQTTKMTRGAYRYISSTYLVCERDAAAPVQFQEMFARTIGAEVQRCDAGHSPMLSQPDDLAKRIDDAAAQALQRNRG